MCSISSAKRPGQRAQQRGIWIRQKQRSFTSPGVNAARTGLGSYRVNTVNPEAVIAGGNIWSGGWAESRAKKPWCDRRGRTAKYYTSRTLLNEIIYPEDIANACFAFVGGLLEINRKCNQRGWRYCKIASSGKPVVCPAILF